MSRSAASAPVSPRKSPVQSRSAGTVDAILEAAARILETAGFAGYTTNAVARRAGVSIGSLYQYFPGKDALTAALIRRETAVLLSDIAALDAISSGREGLRGTVGAAVAHQMRRPVLARLLDFEEVRLPLSEDNQRVGLAIRKTLEGLLVKPDMPPPADVALAAADLLAITKGMVDAAGERGEDDAAALEARVWRAAAGYLGLEPSAQAKTASPEGGRE